MCFSIAFSKMVEENRARHAAESESVSPGEDSDDQSPQNTESGVEIQEIPEEESTKIESDVEKQNIQEISPNKEEIEPQKDETFVTQCVEILENCDLNAAAQ